MSSRIAVHHLQHGHIEAIIDDIQADEDLKVIAYNRRVSYGTVCRIMRKYFTVVRLRNDTPISVFRSTTVGRLAEASRKAQD